jgi:hypothetical protein
MSKCVCSGSKSFTACFSLRLRKLMKSVKHMQIENPPFNLRRISSARCPSATGRPHSAASYDGELGAACGAERVNASFPVSPTSTAAVFTHVLLPESCCRHFKAPPISRLLFRKIKMQAEPPLLLLSSAFPSFLPASA